MKFDYSKLLGKIKECGLTQAELSEKININKSTFNAKVKGHFAFTSKEILSTCRVLSIPENEIGDYFFTEEVQNSKQEEL